MSEGQTMLLGSIAGVTILLGLPLGRLRAPRPGLRQFLNALAIGILIFLLWDVLAHAWEPVDGALGKVHSHEGGLWPVIGYAALFLSGLGIGLISLVAYEGWLAGRGRPQLFGPGTMAVGELTARRGGLASWSPARRLALLIAVGIGLHNFGEGLAIGGSAASGEINLAMVLVLGFAMHNATEGFGIVAPLAADNDRPSWRFLLAMGVIGGGPTFFGTAVGRQFTSDALSVIFLTLAAGSILYVIIQLLGVAQRAGRKELLYGGLLAGLAAGFLTDMVVTAAGA
ncbi:MAG TPA: ZIP family metal transporter [Dehalococcoidia bacterium]|jgi:ZIP family zinc transporter